MASQSFAEEDLSCPVCCDIYINPVLLPCSHSVCSACIQKVWENKTSKECPVCRSLSSNDRPPLNLALRNLCESFQQDRSQRSSSEDEMVCSFHKEKLLLFCLDDQQPVCLVCRDSRKHSNHRFCPVDEAAMDNKDILNTSLEHLREELRISVNHEQNLCKTAEDIKFQAQQTEMQIKEEFEELHQFLRNEEETRITALREEEEQKSKKIKQKMEETTKQISSLRSIIRDIEEQMKAEDVSFLQNFKATLQRAQYSLPDPDLSPSETITFPNHLTNLKFNVLQKMQGNIDKSSDFSINHSHVLFDDSVKYNEYKHFQSSRGNSPNMFGGQRSKETKTVPNLFWGARPVNDSRQVKENETKTVTNLFWGARPVNDSQQVKENETKTVPNLFWGARPVNDSRQVKENETKTVTDFLGGTRPANDSRQVKENETKTVTDFLGGARPVNDSQQVKENQTKTVTDFFGGARPVNDSQQVKENQTKTVTDFFGGARPVNDSQQVKENETRTVTNFWGERPVNYSQ
ncbi:E3 ubiquitin-protein ligase TRIM17-like isoform X22 [Ctenopharyngodon idella]|uniref:E3 ubiquitin-protein ligase TRIM17-like isoform X22 n=1 Tax=Ctenopharyngodon idella TaxID=7959 RepID=UPI002230EFBA|nr:E3 ubiquitin-protein ligase TRIM17-like isoform X22 [Ctenopharyngodon idella]